MAGKREPEQRAAYFDAEGSPTEDPARAVRGEILEQDERGRRRRTWFLIEEVELKWLPVSEGAFLLWVLLALALLWVLLGLAFGLI
jgi:hypothetical protein